MANEGTGEGAANQDITAAGKAAAPGAQQNVQIDVDDTHVAALYANFCRVTGSPEELIVDFGLNPQPMSVPKNPIQISQRIILNYYTAKRLFYALSASLQRHEQIFGQLEIDVNKRVKMPPQ